MKQQVTLGIDIGGTNTAFGFVDRGGKLWAEGNISTTKFSQVEDFLKDLYNNVEKLLKTIKNEVQLVGIGIGAPNANFHRGTIENAVNLGWQGIIPFCDMVKEYFPTIPVLLTNDANAATIGEMVYGGAKEMKDFVMITLGTGVGSGFVSNGKLIYGNDGFAGEFGHCTVKPNGRQCGCGRTGCLETYASATGVKRTAYKMMAKYNYPSELRAVSFNDMTSKMVFDAAQKGDLIAISTFKYTAKILGEALANMVTITSPEAIFVMGGLAKAGDLLINQTKEHMELNMLFMFANKVKILPSQIKGNVAIYGGAALAWDGLDKV